MAITSGHEVEPEVYFCHFKATEIWGFVVVVFVVEA